MPQLVKHICYLARFSQCDHILGVYPDELYCHAAYEASIALGIPFSTYFHNTYLDNEAVDRRRAGRIQPLLFERSQTVFVISEGMKEFYDQKYALGKCVALPHTFENYPPLDISIDIDRSNSDKCRLVLYGNFNESNREATSRFIDAVKNDGRFEVHLYTDVPRVLLGRRGIDVANIKYRGSLGHLSFNALFGELRKYDVVVLTHGFSGSYGEVEYRTIFPTRTIPMLLCGRPIFLHSPSNSYLTNFFRDNDCGVVVDEPSVERILQGLASLLNDKEMRSNKVRCARTAASHFYGPQVAEILRQHVNGSVSTAHVV